MRYLPLFTFLLLAACQEDSTNPVITPEQTLTVDAATSWAFVDLGETATQVTVADPATSPAWDIAFLGTSVMLNGGSAGPGGVTGHCLCQNANATDAQVMAFSPESQMPAFDNVAAAMIPAAASEWETDALAPAVTGWWSYNPVAHTVSVAPNKTWLVRTSDGTGFAKVRVVAIENATQASAGKVTIEYALQAAAGAPMQDVRTAVVDVPATGRASFDLQTGTTTTTGWDLAFEGFDIRVNGGISGSGSAGAVLSDTPFAEITDAGAAPSTVYKADAFGGVFTEKPWYRYNLTGNDHQIWPTFDVYLVKRGADVYKIQIINYYGPEVKPRQITFRYEKVG